MADPTVAAEAARDSFPAPLRLTACVIVRDEEQEIAGCLASVSFCDELVVVDSGSIDRTVEIARAAGARVVEQPWLGFARQRNVALDHAHGTWVLEIDADERVTPELRAEIVAFVDRDPSGIDLAGLPLREELVGHELGPSAKYPKYRHRLLRRGALHHDPDRTVHEGLVPQGPVHPFTGDLRHGLARSWGQAVADARSYALLETQQLVAPRTPTAVLRGLVMRPTAKLGYRLIIDGGWRDGWPGLAKIALDLLVDVEVWARHALHPAPAFEDGKASAGEHFGAWNRRRGAPRVVGIAHGAGAAARATSWLERAAEQGADVALLASSALAAGAGADGVRRRALPSSGPIEVLRALDAERQLRPIDAVMTFGERSRRLLGVLPGGGADIFDGAAFEPADVLLSVDTARGAG